MQKPRKRRFKIENKKQFPYWFHVTIWIIWTVVLVFFIFEVDPIILKSVGLPGTYSPALLVFWWWSGWLIGILCKNVWRGLLWGLIISGYVLLRIFNLGQWWNGILLLILGLVIESYNKGMGEKQEFNS